MHIRLHIPYTLLGRGVTLFFAWHWQFVILYWVLLGSRVYLLFRESLKGEYFPDFLVQYKTGIRFFCLLPSHLGNSTELTEFNQFIPSSTDSKHTDVSGVGIDSVRTESYRTRPIF